MQHPYSENMPLYELEDVSVEYQLEEKNLRHSNIYLLKDMLHKL